MVWEEIEVLEIVEEEITTPRTLMSDQTDTYSIPFRVSSVPPLKWVSLFEKLWNNPPAFIQDHRPEIARLVGDKVILDDTNIDEIESVHFGTLQMIIDETNRQYAEWLAEMEMYSKAQEVEMQFRGHIADVINRLPLRKETTNAIGAAEIEEMEAEIDTESGIEPVTDDAADMDADGAMQTIAEDDLPAASQPGMDNLVELNTEKQANGFDEHEETMNGDHNEMAHEEDIQATDEGDDVASVGNDDNNDEDALHYENMEASDEENDAEAASTEGDDQPNFDANYPIL